MKWRASRIKQLERRLEAVEKMARCRHESTKLTGPVGIPFGGWDLYIGRLGMGDPVAHRGYGKEICENCGKVVHVFESKEAFLREQIRRKRKEAEALRKQLEGIVERNSEEDSNAGSN